MNERRLRKSFRFTEEDLLANRHGQFSEGQKKRLSQEARAEQASARNSAAILFVIAAAGMAVGITIGSIAPSQVSGVLILLLMGILWPSAWAGKGLQILHAAHARQKPHLAKVSGRAHLIRHPDDSYILRVGEYEFDLDSSPSGAIVEGDEYTVYYLESNEEILSVEYFIQDKST